MDETTGTRVNEHEETREIRRDIERTQREMSRTIDEIQHRLSPQYMMQRTKESVREAGVKTSRSVVDKITSNPIPAAMVGIGLWLMMRNQHEDVDVEFYPNENARFDQYGRPYSSVTSEARETMHEAGERVSAAVDSARSAATDAMHRLGERTNRLAQESRYGMRRATTQSRDFLTGNPLASGLIGLALGALVGTLVPETDRENELMGATRDRLADRARDMAHEGVDRAKDVVTKVASAAADAAKETAQQEARKTDVGTNIGLGGTQG